MEAERWRQRGATIQNLPRIGLRECNLVAVAVVPFRDNMALKEIRLTNSLWISTFTTSHFINYRRLQEEQTMRPSVVAKQAALVFITVPV